MANRRMVSLKIVDTDLFLEMPVTARLLYYDLLVRADDDGFVAAPKKIQRMIRVSDDDFKLLMAKKFIIPFPGGVCVIRHWKIHNYIKKDRYSPTIYQDERKKLSDNNGVYELNDSKNVIPSGTEMEPECIQNGSKMDTQDRLGKDRLELGKDRLDNKISWEGILVAWNDLPEPIKPIRAITDRRKDKIKARINSLNLKQEDILQAINNIQKSSFLQGKNSREWIIYMDWLFQDDTRFSKVFEGQYTDKEGGNGENRYANSKKNTGENKYDPDKLDNNE